VRNRKGTGQRGREFKKIVKGSYVEGDLEEKIKSDALQQS